jgi:hypothetical protein
LLEIKDGSNMQKGDGICAAVIERPQAGIRWHSCSFAKARSTF